MKCSSRSRANKQFYTLSFLYIKLHCKKGEKHLSLHPCPASNLNAPTQTFAYSTKKRNGFVEYHQNVKNVSILGPRFCPLSLPQGWPEHLWGLHGNQFFLSDPGPIIVSPCLWLTHWLTESLTTLLKINWIDICWWNQISMRCWHWNEIEV